MKHLKDKKKYVFGACVLVLLLFIVGGIFFFVGKKEKDSSKSDEISNFSLELISKKFENNTSEFEFEVKNISNKKRYLNELRVLVKDNYDLVLSTLYGVVDSEIEPGKSVTVALSVGEDLSDYDDFQYEIEK